MDLPFEARPFQLYGEGAATYAPDLVHLEAVADRASLHNWFIGAHRHPTIVQLLHVEQGSCVLLTEHGETALALPSMVLTPCDCPHAFRFSPDTKGWVLSVAAALLYNPRVAITDKERFLERNAIETIAIPTEDDQARLIGSLFREIERRRIGANIPVTDGVLAALALLFSLVQEISSAASEEREGLLGPRRALFSRFMQLVEQGYRQGLPVGAYAHRLGTSQATLTRACREITGKAPGALVNERRLREAKRSLSFTTASVKQIADALGYEDPAYFARSFRQHTGTTASEFRRKTMRPAPELEVMRRRKIRSRRVET